MGKAKSWLRDSWKQVRQDFFPSWDRAGQWRAIKLASNGNLHGECDKDRKIVRVRVVDDVDEMHVNLIHEICHQVGGLGHGKRWQRRMQVATIQATKLGRENLAQMLRDEIGIYQEGGMSFSDLYDIVREMVLNQPSITLDSVKVVLVRDHVSQATISKKLHRLPLVFNQAKREAARI